MLHILWVIGKWGFCTSGLCKVAISHSLFFGVRLSLATAVTQLN